MPYIVRALERLMTRVVERTEVGPQRIRKDEVADDLWICRCGLSQSQPFCDGSHRLARSEDAGVLYHYIVEDGNLVRRPVTLVALAGEPASEPAPAPTASGPASVQAAGGK
jgi:CDGSH-type Zn-finger protein